MIVEAGVKTTVRLEVFAEPADGVSLADLVEQLLELGYTIITVDHENNRVHVYSEVVG